MASDLGLHCLATSHKKDNWHIWVNTTHAQIEFENIVGPDQLASEEAS